MAGLEPEKRFLLLKIIMNEAKVLSMLVKRSTQSMAKTQHLIMTQSNGK
jgi:hypothetical protein